eukprot:scaffold58_cov256-Pinguiococcus_pyrenoidosus.AAC.3
MSASLPFWLLWVTTPILMASQARIAAPASLRLSKALKPGYEVLRCVAGDDAAAAARRQVLILPGNPGIPGYYEDFATALAKRLSADGGVTVTALGLLGHCADAKSDPTTFRVFGLDEQIEHATEQLGELEKAAPRDAKIAVLGHSIGANIGLKAVHALDWPQKVKAVGLLTPFLQNNDDNPDFASKKRLATMGFAWRLLAFLGFLVQLLPLFLRRILFHGTVKDMDTKARELTLTAMLRRRS